MMELSAKAVRDCRHMLGLTQSKKSYRNYYCSGDQEILHFEKMVDNGLATKRESGSEMGGIYYHLTEKGINLIKEYIGDFKVKHD